MSLNRQTCKLPGPVASAVTASLEDWKKNNKVARLWQKDASLWSGADESNWLGWLTITEEQLARIDVLKQIANDIKKARFKHALLLGMGGSSLCPEVLRMTFGKVKGYPELHVLDSTDPAQIKAVERKLDLKSTICIVSSKSGSTLEPNIYKQYFFERVKAKVGEKEVGSRFIAITDPGSKMQQVAEGDKFRKIFMGVPSIGGRYSALSNFGMVPAAVMGLDVAKFLKNTEEMVKACGASSPADANPGVILGTVLGVAANHGRDKLTIIASPRIFDLGAWLEQLIAESTGKVGKGIIPVDRERLAKPAAYSNDRVFAYLRLTSKPNKAQDTAVAALEKAGHPVRHGTKDECELRRVQQFLAFEDPSGNKVEIVVRPFHSGERYFPARDAGITHFSHIGLRTSDAPRDEAFWTRLLNARVSDWIGDAPLLRIGTIHHTLALFPSPPFLGQSGHVLEPP